MPLSNLSERLFGLLSRRTSSGTFLPEVDGIRFFAILAVMFEHAGIDLAAARGQGYQVGWSQGHGLLLRLIGEGWFGVEFFFVLSGFIVSLPFALHRFQGAPAPAISRYFLRRLTRIEPPYIMALTAMYLKPWSFRHFLPDYAAGLIYSHMLIFGAANPLAIFTWSLEVEVSFYLVAPWLTRIYRFRNKRLRWLLQLAMIAAVALLAQFGPPMPRFKSTFAQMMNYFLAGILFADLYASGLIRRSARFIWDIVAIAASALLAILISRPAASFFWLDPILILLIFTGIFGGRFLNPLFRLRAVTAIGGMCYTLYLWHGLILMSLPYRLKELFFALSYTRGILLYCLLIVPAMIAICVPIYLLTEKPFMNGPGSRLLESSLRALGRIWKSPAEQTAEISG